MLALLKDYDFNFFRRYFMKYYDDDSVIVLCVMGTMLYSIIRNV